ncbi:MAG TPA: protein-L-isoaspartate(D-aspartate) O-methyltransferase [Candidatus Limnocylindria bacterium]|nr:protein-L-isoaspartate(D-aspartate) O-methyltransferase [Candidatus Limnocylindria bacterium]
MRLRIGRRSPAPTTGPAPDGAPNLASVRPDADALAWNRARAEMVSKQLERRGLRDPRVLAAMAAVPREAFVPGVPASVAYDDRALPIDAGQTISQPYVVARMTELLGVEPGDRILEIGTGSGYQAAVLARLGARVTSIERHAGLAGAARERLSALGVAGVDVRVGDGSAGVPAGAPWDGIIVTAAAPAIPATLREQLEIGARLVIPVGSREQQDLRIIERATASDWRDWSDGAVVFVPLIGEAGWAPGEDTRG